MSYDARIWAIEPVYRMTRASKAGREVEVGTEVHLSKFSVQVNIHGKDRHHEINESYEAVFDVDHAAEVVTMQSIGDAHGERKSFNSKRLLLATHYADRAASAYLSDMNLGYRRETLADSLEAVLAYPSGVDVHTNLEVETDD